MDEENKILEEVTEIKTVAKETTYPIQTFIDNSEALGYNKIVVSGALFGYKEKELTKSKFADIVENFLRKRVE